jgi:hypothetical protein
MWQFKGPFTSIPAWVKTVLVFTNSTIESFKTGRRGEEPCKYHGRYKGVRSPNCLCKPCLVKYMDSAWREGRLVYQFDKEIRNDW